MHKNSPLNLVRFTLESIGLGLCHMAAFWSIVRLNMERQERTILKLNYSLVNAAFSYDLQMEERQDQFKCHL